MDDSEREPTDAEIDTAASIVREIATRLLIENAVYERDFQQWRIDTYDEALVAIAEEGLEIDNATVNHMARSIVHDLNRLPNRFPKRD